MVMVKPGLPYLDVIRADPRARRRAGRRLPGVGRVRHALRRRRARLDGSAARRDGDGASRCAAPAPTSLITYFARELAETLGGRVAAAAVSCAPMTTTPSAPAATWFDRARTVTPGGVHSPVRAFAAMHCDPIAIVSARGAHVRDADGPRRSSTTSAPGDRRCSATRHPAGRAGGGRRRQPRPGLRPGLAAGGRPGRAHRRAGAGLRADPLRRHRHRGDDERGAGRARRHRPPRRRQVRRRLPRARRHVPGQRRVGRRHLRHARLARRHARRGGRTRAIARFNDLASVDRCFADADGRRRRGDRRAGGRQHGLRAARRRLPRRPARRAAPGTARCSSSTR